MKIENVKIYDLEESIKASKYPMALNTDDCNSNMTETVKKLAKCPKGTGHDQFLTGIRIAFDLTFTNKAWVELERYHFTDFISSQSTMHCITKLNIKKQCNKYVWDSTIEQLEKHVKIYNNLEDKSTEIAKDLYLEILYNVPSGFQLTARLTTSYRQLKTIFSQRKNHRLPEWRDFCTWVESLPYAKELITIERKND